MKNFRPLEIEYQELASGAFKNYKIGIRISTTPETYEIDFTSLVIEVKSKLQKIMSQDRVAGKAAKK